MTGYCKFNSQHNTSSCACQWQHDACSSLCMDKGIDSSTCMANSKSVDALRNMIIRNIFMAIME